MSVNFEYLQDPRDSKKLSQTVAGNNKSLPKVLELSALEISKYHHRCSLAGE